MTFRHDDPSWGATAIAYSDEKLPPQVLVVDDSKEVREFITLLLRLSGYRVLKAEDGLAAQNILMIEHPALVISDLEMPISDGWDVLAYCHAQHPDMPVLIISGAALGQRPEIECWAAGFLLKPFSLARFRAEVQRLCFPIGSAAAGVQHTTGRAAHTADRPKIHPHHALLNLLSANGR
jgi:CheY-like chemotaxis protein